jgi:glutathione S-transferase
MGDEFSVADGYLFTTLSWMKYIGIDLATLPNLAAFQARVARPAVQKVLKDEGLA